jgi:hypothetical protein
MPAGWPARGWPNRPPAKGPSARSLAGWGGATRRRGSRPGNQLREFDTKRKRGR